MKKPFHFLFSALFILACLLPGLGLFLFGPSPAAGNETPVQPPSLTTSTGSFNTEFLSQASDWFSRSFGFRRELITADSALKASVFRTSTQSLVSLGQEDWLYYAETLDDFTGADTLSPRQAYCIAHSLKLAQDYAQSQGAAFVFTIAPNKASIYPEHLPSGLAPAAQEYSAPAVEALAQEGVNYADLFTALRARKEELDTLRNFGEPLYFTLDSHWTNRGAALGHDVLLEALGLPGEDAFAKPGQYGPSHRGDLYDMLYPASSRLDYEFAFQEPLAFAYARPIRDVDDLRIETASASQNGPLLMFRDSFGNALHSLMAESFSTARFSRAMPYDLSQIGETGAQYVVVEMVERNLPLLAEAPFIFPAPEVDLENPPWGTGLFHSENLTTEGGGVAIEQAGAYLRVTASATPGCDTDSPVYLVKVGPTGPIAAWEAQPSFMAGIGEEITYCTAYLEEEVEEEALHMVFRQNGQWKLALSHERYMDTDSGSFPEGALFPGED